MIEMSNYDVFFIYKKIHKAEYFMSFFNVYCTYRLSI